MSSKPSRQDPRPAAPQGTAPPERNLVAAVAAHPAWYHTIELGPGVTTPGMVDLRRLARRVLPDRLDGLRALDVGTFDGFWAFEMERRGAHVVAIDLPNVNAAELPPRARPELEDAMRDRGVQLGPGFELASAALGSKVQRTECAIYDLRPELIGGAVDFVFAGAILLHLRDPVGALERILDTLVVGGQLVAFEPFAVRETLLAPRRPVARFQASSTAFNWWTMNLAGLRALAEAAGFVEVRRAGIHRVPSRRRLIGWSCALGARRGPVGADGRLADASTPEIPRP